ncbi:uncharacterized protein TA18810 [Theileria annulata]|uniref:Uncharacterized protein n=1 Tax=Theileria annulata TaxID=5874 RepID=Q4UBC6_THEAN|nr:uncharacterized protein TA18810 [Theileria annulata]CAI75875.1 hypothetical protein TA18810 [Theileria annulata]|eukprot:XP_955351.1 hypothetical protein TA18810 [Theileria annulata]
MGSSLEDLSLENTLNEFIKANSNDNLFLDVENPSCRVVSPNQKDDSPSSNTSGTGTKLRKDISNLLNEVSELSKNLNVSEVSRSLVPDLTQKPNSSISSGRSLNGDYSKSLVEHAQAVIDYQRERIDILENIVSKFNSAMDKVNELHKDELERSETENKNIRLQIHKIVSDYDAIIKKKDSEIREIEDLKAKNFKTGCELVKKDEQIKEMSKKLEILPKEYERVKTQRDDLLDQVRELKNELNPPYKSWQRALEDAQRDNGTMGSVQLPFTTSEYQGQFGFINQKEWSSSSQQFPHFLCDVRKQETAAMGRCLMQVENDLTSYKRLHDEQRSEINRLNYLLSVKAKTEALDENPYFGSHKQLLYMRNLFVEMVKKSNELTDKLNQKKEEPVEKEDRSVQAALMVKSFGEQREMYDKLLAAVKNKISVESSGTCFYSCKLDYCKLSDAEQINLDLKFNRMFVEIENSMVLVHQLEEDRIIHTQTISRENLKAVRSDSKKLQVMLRDDHYHVFRPGDLDSYKRFKYGLMYAGFLLDETKLSIFSKIDLSDQNTLENLPKDMAPVLFSKVVSLGSQNPNYTSSPLSYPHNLDQRYYQSNLDFLVNNMFDNVSILSDFTERLAYYDQSCNVLVFYGPNLANNPKILHPRNTYKFLVKNDLGDSNGLNHLQTPTEEEFIEEYRVPLATFPNGEQVINYFNPQLNNYSLVSVKQNTSPFGSGLHNGYHQNTQALNSNLPNLPGSNSPTAFDRNLMNMNNPDFEVYFILPLSPKYNEVLTNMMSKIEFLRLKSSFSKVGEHKIEIKEKKKFYKFENGVLEMKMGPSSDGPVRIPCLNSQYEFDDVKSEVTLLSNSNTGGMESFKFSIPDFSMYKEFVSELGKNGLVPLNPGAEVGRGQFCLVTKGFFTIFNKDQSPDPILVFTLENTKVEVDDKGRNIKIVDYESGTCVDMKCLKKGIYPRWIFALKFAGFLKDDEHGSDIEDTTTLNEFLFEIHIFDYDSKGEKAFKFENDKIKLFASPSHGKSHETRSPPQRPLYVWNRENINIELRPKNSRVRIYVNKGKKNQEFFEIQFIPPAYDDFISELKKNNYKIDSPDKLKSTNHQYVVSLKEVIQLRQSMDSPSSMLMIQKKFYDCSVDIEAMKVTFTPTVNHKTPIELPFKKQETFLKFLLALKISTFLPFTKKGTDIPINFFPEITYCFACPEARKLFKNCRQ